MIVFNMTPTGNQSWVEVFEFTSLGCQGWGVAFWAWAFGPDLGGKHFGVSTGGF